MEAIISGINWLDDFIWGMPMIVLLLGTHLFMTVAHRLHSAQDLYRYPSVRAQGPRRPRRREPVPGPHHRPGVHHRHGQHHRRGYRHLPGRPWCGVLVLACRRVRNRHQVRRVPYRRKVPGPHPRREDAGRRHVRSGTGTEPEVAGGALRRPGCPGLLRHRLRYPDQRNRRGH